jgi:hypothetical protein
MRPPSSEIGSRASTRALPLLPSARSDTVAVRYVDELIRQAGQVPDEQSTPVKAQLATAERK